jgi:uncharacterized cupredoxin-like copper-binding protein
MPKIRPAAIVPILGLVLTAGSPAQESWQTVRIEADEYRFVPNRIQLSAGKPVMIEIRNTGNEQHEFRSRLFRQTMIEVEGSGLTVKGSGIHSILIEKSTTATIKWLSPAAGSYDFECRIPSHHGMDGTIVVEEEAPNE